MKLTLAEISAAVQKLLGNEDSRYKAELTSLQNTVATTLTDLETKLSAAITEIANLKGQITDLTASKTKLQTDFSAASTQVDDFNKLLTEACINGNLLMLNGADGKPLAADAAMTEKLKAAESISLSDKFKAYQGALNAAHVHANIPNKTLPAAPVVASTGNRTDGSMRREAFFKLAPSAQLDFVKGGGKITD